MEPFGPDNPRPIFITKNVNAEKSYLVKDEHIKFYLQQDDITFNGIGFRMKEKLELTKKPIDIAFTIDENTWNGTTTLQLKIVDIREAINSD
jgi:single-stranded-DNA-specific exonuclease